MPKLTANIFSIDPGPTQSAWVLYHHQRHKPQMYDLVPNEQLLETLCDLWVPSNTVLVIERMECFGMPVGASVFDTCYWIGRFWQAWCHSDESRPFAFMSRRVVKVHLCNSVRAKDTNIRQALLDRWGGKEAAIGKKANPGPLYGIKKDIWSALAIAVTYAETNLGRM